MTQMSLARSASSWKRRFLLVMLPTTRTPSGARISASCMNLMFPSGRPDGRSETSTRINPADVSVIPAINHVYAGSLLFIPEDENRNACKFHLHDRLADRQGRNPRLHLGDDDRLKVLGLLLLRFSGCGEDIGGRAKGFNRLRALAMVVLQAALVAAKLFFHLRRALLERRVYFRRGSLRGGRKPRREMNDRLAGILVSVAREDDMRIGRTSGVLVEYCAEFAFHMGLKRLADVDLFAADLIPHGTSRGLSSAMRARHGAAQAGDCSVDMSGTAAMGRGQAWRVPGSLQVRSGRTCASSVFGSRRRASVNGAGRAHPIRKFWPR